MIFGGYELGELLGTGSYSNVYKVQNRDLAIKVYETFDHYTPNESHIMNLGITQVPKLLDFVYDLNKDSFGIVMPLADCTLSAYLRSMPMNNERKRHYIRTIARSINELHNHGFSHSDIKMDNILIFDDVPYLIDFSLSSTFSTIDPDCVMSEEYQTPEVRYRTASPREEVLRTSDSWAFGCLCVLIYLNVSEWSKFSYSSFIEYLRCGGNIIELIDTKLDEDDKLLLLEIQDKYLNMDYIKREWFELSVAYQTENLYIIPIIQNINFSKLGKRIAKFFDNSRKHDISNEVTEKAYRLYAKNVFELKKHKEVTKIKEWKHIFLYICLDICCVVYKSDDANTHKFFQKLSKLRYKDYKNLYIFFVIRNRGYFSY